MPGEEVWGKSTPLRIMSNPDDTSDTLNTPPDTSVASSLAAPLFEKNKTKHVLCVKVSYDMGEAVHRVSVQLITGVGGGILPPPPPPSFLG